MQKNIAITKLVLKINETTIELSPDDAKALLAELKRIMDPPHQYNWYYPSYPANPKYPYTWTSGTGGISFCGEQTTEYTSWQ